MSDGNSHEVSDPTRPVVARVSGPNFDGYAVVDYWPDQWRSLPGRAARAEYRKLMDAIPRRMEALEVLLRRNGLPMGYEDADLQLVNDWFRQNVTSDSSGAWPALVWRSFARDFGIFLGQGAVASHDHLRWDFATTGPTLVEYRQHVVLGFGRAGYERHRISPSGAMFTYATRAIQPDRTEIVVVNGRPLEIDAGPIEQARLVDFSRRLCWMAG